HFLSTAVNWCERGRVVFFGSDQGGKLLCRCFTERERSSKLCRVKIGNYEARIGRLTYRVSRIGIVGNNLWASITSLPPLLLKPSAVRRNGAKRQLITNSGKEPD